MTLFEWIFPTIHDKWYKYIFRTNNFPPLGCVNCGVGIRCRRSMTILHFFICVIAGMDLEMFRSAFLKCIFYESEKCFVLTTALKKAENDGIFEPQHDRMNLNILPVFWNAEWIESRKRSAIVHLHKLISVVAIVENSFWNRDE